MLSQTRLEIRCICSAALLVISLFGLAIIHCNAQQLPLMAAVPVDLIRHMSPLNCKDLVVYQFLILPSSTSSYPHFLDLGRKKSEITSLIPKKRQAHTTTSVHLYRRLVRPKRGTQNEVTRASSLTLTRPSAARHRVAIFLDRALWQHERGYCSS